MVWAPIWLPKPSRRPSRRHPKKNLNFDTYFLLSFDCFGAPLEHPKSQKNVRMHLGGGPILAPKVTWEENGAPRCYFKAFWLPKLELWQRMLTAFCTFLGSRKSNSIRHRPPNNALAKKALQLCNCQICIPIVHLPKCVPIMHLRNKLPNNVLANQAFQLSASQIGISIGYLPDIHPENILAKWASSWAVAGAQDA